MKEDDMSEASPRPWRVDAADPTLVVDQRGEIIIDLSTNNFGPEAEANAALIVATVNAQWEREAPLRAWNQPIGCARSAAPSAVRNDSLCDRPLDHAAGCECGQL